MMILPIVAACSHAQEATKVRLKASPELNIITMWFEKADLLRYRDALCYARLRGSRVVPFEEEKVTEGPVQAGCPGGAKARQRCRHRHPGRDKSDRHKAGGVAVSVQQLRRSLQGAKLARLRVAHLRPNAEGEERGIFATEQIRNGDIIAEVPQRWVLSAEKARESEVGKAFLEVFPEASALPRNKLIFLLDLMAARSEAHPMHSYVATLPSQSPTPMSWPSNLRAMLADTNLGAAVAEERSQLEEEFANIMPKLQKERPELFGELFNLEAFLWAHGMWFSRRFPTAMAAMGKSKDYSWRRSSEEEMEEESDGEGALVPFMDFTNHQSGTQIVWQADAEKVTFVAGGDIPSGSEVFNNYGDKSNEDLLLIHGFALVDNIYDTYSLWLTVQVSDQPKAKKAKKRRLRTERIGPFHLRRLDPRWEQFPPELWQALSSTGDHIRALSTLVKQRLQDFLETKTRDRHFAAGGAAEGQELDPRIRYIARYRDGQRQVLEECNKALEEMAAKAEPAEPGSASTCT
ncbi:unnamed protein product [Effrenium voratum]|nr:unnamed protein product [Effrenium voratum]